MTGLLVMTVGEYLLPVNVNEKVSHMAVNF